jgi:hypothetical protein
MALTGIPERGIEGARSVAMLDEKHTSNQQRQKRCFISGEIVYHAVAVDAIFGQVLYIFRSNRFRSISSGRCKL